MKYLLPVFLCLFVIACKKNDQKQPSNTELVSSSSWRYESGGIDADKNGTIDFSFSAGLLPLCVLDNVATFHSDGSGVGDEGPSKCSPTALQTTPFTWNFLSNETILNINGSLLSLSGQFRIVSLSSAKFSLSKDTTALLGGVITPINMIVNLQH
jgi:hypothetical protein